MRQSSAEESSTDPGADEREVAASNSDADDVLDAFRDLAAGRDARKDVAILEGRVVIERALQSGAKLRVVVGTAEAIASLNLSSQHALKLRSCSAQELRSLVGFDFHRGVLASLERPRPRTIARLVEEWPVLGLVLVLDRIADPRNVGALLRTARALGVTQVVLGPGCADPYQRIALRASMGNTFGVRLYQAEDLAGALSSVRAQLHARVCIATLAADAALVVPGAPPPTAARRVLVVGNEGEGVNLAVEALADERVQIPVAPGSDSLNVVVAASILLWWLARASEAPIRNSLPG